MSLIATIALPLFLMAVFWAAFQLLSGHSFTELLAAAPAGRHLGMAEAITAVTGSFIIGAIVTPDVSRFMRSGKDVFWMTLIATFVGELSINLLAVAMALLLRSADIVTLMSALTGWLGATIAVVSTVKLNNLNLYSSSLGFSTLLHALRLQRNGTIDRGRVTWWVGITSTVLSMLGILDHFIGFLVLLGVAIPPVAGIMIVDYYLLRRDRTELLRARATGQLPTESERFNPVALVAAAGLRKRAAAAEHRHPGPQLAGDRKPGVLGRHAARRVAPRRFDCALRPRERWIKLQPRVRPARAAGPRPPHRRACERRA
jgi:cytosine permease